MDAFYEIVMLRTGHFFFKEVLTGSDTIAGIAVFLQETGYNANHTDFI